MSGKEYIELGKVIDAIMSIPVPADSYFTQITDAGKKLCVSVVKNLQSADVAPVVHGRWENIKSAKNTIRCSNCGHIRELKHFGEIIKRPKFCEMCGAKMDEETEMKYEIHPDGTMTLNPAYTEILRLDKMLTKKGIDHKTERLYDGYRVGVNYDGREIGDAVEHYFSYGNEENLLETMGFGEYDVTGRRTAEDVMTVVEATIESKRKGA